jgi:hypothetical protein
MRRNHSPCQQIETTHHWPQHPANKWTVSPIRRRKKTPKNMARRPCEVVPENHPWMVHDSRHSSYILFTLQKRQ